MDWSDPAVQFGSQQIDEALRDFCHEALLNIRLRALELLSRLRASRVTLEYLRQVSSADIVSGKMSALVERTSPISVMTPLDDNATKKVKGYLRRRVEKLKMTASEEFRCLVPQNREMFEKGFDRFVEASMEKTSDTRSAWLESHVSSGAAQPQLWKIYVVFQRQLRDACDAECRKPLPPPLFMTKQEDDAAVAESPSHHRHTASHIPLPVSHEPGISSHPPLSARMHSRAQSCGEFGRCLRPYGCYGLVNVPCILTPAPYPMRPENIPGYHSAGPNDFQRDYTEQWIAGLGIQDDIEWPYGHTSVMLPVGFRCFSPIVTDGRLMNAVRY